MFPLLFSCLMAAGPLQDGDSLAVAPPAARHTATADSLHTDTLREVTVRARTKLPVQVAIDQSLLRMPRVLSAGDLLEKLSPGINDKITHPFAVKARKQEKRRARSLKRLEEYDKVRTFDELLREAYERQLREDAAAK